MSARRTGSAHLAAAACCAALAGCVNLAPEYGRPAAPVARAWPGGGDQGAPQNNASEVGWAEFYGDARLRELIGQAQANNRGVRSTVLAIESARAQYRIADASTLPGVDGSAGLSAQRGSGQTTRRYSAGIGFSAFEIDFFGRLHNLREQALENFLGAEETLRAARISLVAEVASAYVTLAADQQRLRLAQDTLASQQKSFDLTQRTFRLGAASALDVAQAQSTLDSARADIATYRTQVAQDLNALTLLVGQPISEALIPDTALTNGELLQGRRPDIGPGADLPSQLLQRRPDVLAAERSLRAAHASIGAARAARFPSITLTGSAGLASGQLADLFKGASRTWSFIPGVSMPIFDGGAGAAGVRVAEVQREAALAAYEQAIQTAFREVADALAQRRDIGELLAARQSLVAANEKGYRLSEARYRRGVDSSLTVLDAQRSSYGAQQNLISARLAEAKNLITLYSVLGGGWK